MTKTAALCVAFLAVGEAYTALCPYPIAQFFAHVESSIESAGGGRYTQWNSSSFWVHDENGTRSRLDTMSSERALSSGSFFYQASHNEVSVDGFHYNVDGDKNCTVTEDLPVLDACSGSIARFMPPETRSGILSATDALLGHEELHGVACTVFGWDQELFPGAVDKMHRVWISNTTGAPVAEFQGQGLVTGYATKFFARFSPLENIQGSFDYMAKCPQGGCIFKKPDECA